MVGDTDVSFEMCVLEDGRLVYAIVIGDVPVLGFDKYGAEDLIAAIKECVDELESYGDAWGTS